MSQASDGSALSNCRHCQEPFPSVNARFCSQCGKLRFQRKQCLLCQLHVPDRKKCKNCLAPLNPNEFYYTPLKCCSNRECNAYLVQELQKCYKCHKEQECIPPRVPDPQPISDELSHIYEPVCPTATIPSDSITQKVRDIPKNPATGMVTRLALKF